MGPLAAWIHNEKIPHYSVSLFSAHELWCSQNFTQSIGCKSGRNGKEWCAQTEIIGNEIEFDNHFQVCPKGMCMHLTECIGCI